MKITVWPEPIWIIVNSSWLLLPQHQPTYPRGPESASIKIQCETIKNSFWKGGFQLIQILSLLGMCFDAVVVEVKKNLLLFRLALAILWDIITSKPSYHNNQLKNIWREWHHYLYYEDFGFINNLIKKMSPIIGTYLARYRWLSTRNF